MRRLTMLIPPIALAAWIQLQPAPSAAQASYVEVTFRCPVAGQILTFDWRDPLGGEYTEGGKRHDLKFSLSGGTVAPAIYATGGGPKRSGDRIRCDYSAANPGSTLHASYYYEVHREIITCAADQYHLICRLKP